MIVNFSGCDGTGKTTLANKASEIYPGCEYTHFDKPKDMLDGKNQYFNFLDKIKDNKQIYICDRLHEGEWIYAPLYRGYTANYLTEFEKKLIQQQNYLFVYVKAELETIIQRTRVRGEDFVKEEHFQNILDTFQEFAESQHLPYMVIDTTTAPIEESLKRIEENVKKLDTIWGSYRGCSSCCKEGECIGVSTPTALPRGNIDAKYMVVGQNPGGRGKGTDKFVSMFSEGATSDFLINILKKADIYNDCWFTNIVMCSTSDNKITENQVTSCLDNIGCNIEMIKPDKIFTLGGVTTKFMKQYFKDYEIVEVQHPTFVKRFYSGKPEKIEEYINTFKNAR